MALEDCCLAAPALKLAAHAPSLGSCRIGISKAWLNTPAGKTRLGIPVDFRPVAPIIISYLRALRLNQPVVYALPRGGVPAAGEIAKALKAPLDLAPVCKIEAPGQSELALAALVDLAEAARLNPAQAPSAAGG